MSLDISVSSKRKNRHVETNTLRNPFGLINWAEANVNPLGARLEQDTLWYVCNNWNYDKAKFVDRRLFHRVVHEYWEVLRRLRSGVFHFNPAVFEHWVLPNIDLFPSIREYPSLSRMNESGTWVVEKIVLPMDTFFHPRYNTMHWPGMPRPEKGKYFYLGIKSLGGYKDWFRKLLDMAELLHTDPDSVFYCSN